MPKPSGASEPPLTVKMLSQQIENALAQGLPTSLRVEGEVANASIRNGHQYFSLRETGASIGCVMWSSDVQKNTHTICDGDRLIAVGSVVHWAPGGRTQLRVRRVEPVGEGALLAAFRSRCEALRAQGYFDPSTKQALPAYPRRIAVLTSANGAAIHDVMAMAKLRFPACALLLIDVPVQGAGAAERISAAIDRVSVSQKALAIDAIILTRGGGSLEDLWGFNEQVVADAVLRCTVPIVAAIGHESDVTIAELVADARAPTPTAAAILLLPDREETAVRLGLIERSLARGVRGRVATCHGRITLLRHRLGQGETANLQRSAARIDALHMRMQGAQPAVVLAKRRQSTQALAHRLHSAVHRSHAKAEASLASRRLPEAMSKRLGALGGVVALLDRSLEVVNPEAVLTRGFSLTLDAHGGLIRDAKAVQAGDVLRTRMANGEIRSRVEPASTKD
jgi:exodeoxyribonuclease VII large subunit